MPDKMPDKFHHPYHFIPATGKVNGLDTSAIPYLDIAAGNHDFARHDLWHKDGISGHLTCQITLMTPTFVGGVTNKSDDSTPKVLTHYERNDKPAFPANSLRGMVGSLIESLSQSALRVLHDEEYSVRQVTSAASHKKLGKVILVKGVPHICKLGDGFTPPYLKVRRTSANAFIGSDGNASSVTDVNAYYNPTSETIKQNPDADHNQLIYGSLLVLDPPLPANGEPAGNQPTRVYEKFVENSAATKKWLPIPANVLEVYKTLIKQRTEGSEPILPYRYRHLEHLYINPAQLKEGMFVYYSLDTQHNIAEISPSQIWRSLVPKTTHELFLNETLLPLGAKNQKRETLSPAEMLLGVVELLPEKKTEEDKGHTTKNLASRVRFTDALPKSLEVKQLDCTTLKILARPKPPSPAMYFHKPGQPGKYLSKQDLLNRVIPVIANGRKYYLHHPPKQVEKRQANKHYWETAHAEKDLNQKVAIRPLETDQTFLFNVYFDNLSNAELALLKTALVPNDKYQHRLGLGKSLGLGSIAIAIKTEQYKSDTRYSIENWRGDFTNPSPKPAVDECLIDPPTLHHLTILGDPAKLTQEVRPPLLNDQLNNPESETYKWFVENDKEKYKENGVYVVKEPWQKQTLRHLEDNLPTLESNWTQLSEYEHTQYLTRLNERNLSDQKKQEILKKEQENNLKEQ